MPTLKSMVGASDKARKNLVVNRYLELSRNAPEVGSLITRDGKLVRVVAGQEYGGKNGTEAWNAQPGQIAARGLNGHDGDSVQYVYFITTAQGRNGV